MKKIISIALFLPVFIFANTSTVSNKNSNINTLLQQIKTIQKTLQQKEKNAKKINEKVIYEKKLELIQLKLKILKTYQNYKELSKLNRETLINLIQRINKSLIKLYQNQFFYIFFANKIQIGNKTIYAIPASEWENILYQTINFEEKIKEIKTENNIIPSMAKNDLENLVTNKINAIENDTVFNFNGNLNQNFFYSDKYVYFTLNTLPFIKKTVYSNYIYARGLK